MKKYKIICITQIYNELEKGNLKRFIAYVLPLCDELVVYDDGSTDGSFEYIQKITPHIIKGGKNDFENEIFHKHMLLEQAKKLGADFIFYLDADEVFSVNANDRFQALAQMCIDENIDGLQFHKINLWRSGTWQRIDSLYDIGWFTHFWHITPLTKYTNIKRGLHQNPYPSTIKNIKRVKDIFVLHYGFSNEKNLAYKYFLYKSHGQTGYDMLDRLIMEEKMELKRVPKEIFPKGLYITDEVKPVKKTIQQSLDYVGKYKQQFLKSQGVSEEIYEEFTNNALKKKPREQISKISLLHPILLLKQIKHKIYQKLTSYSV